MKAKSRFPDAESKKAKDGIIKIPSFKPSGWKITYKMKPRKTYSAED